MKRYIVVGLGNFGAGVAEALRAQGHDVAAIDLNEHLVDSLASVVGGAIVGDARDIRVLERVGAREADAAVISTGDDITASILATLALTDLGVQEVYVKVISKDHARVMEKIGVTETIFPERESALRLATRVTSRAILNYVKLGAEFSIQEMAVPDEWLGLSLRDIHLPRRFKVSVVAVHDFLTDQIGPVADPDAPLKDSDSLFVAGRDVDLQKLLTVVAGKQ
ncbi:MAG: TrkA family potassium uptake protein [Gemmatimonas sp.]|nr:TrkA family potassium uptake protein [Gemmatimonas sp.]